MQRRAFLAGTAGLAGAVAGCSMRSVRDDRVSASGDIAVRIDGEPLDLTADRFQSEHADEAIAFHLHEGDDDWYMEGDDRVTVGEGLDLLPNFAYDREGGYRRLAIDDASYDASSAGTELAAFVDDSVVDPSAYRLQDGDALLVAITTTGSQQPAVEGDQLSASGDLGIRIDGDPFDLTADRFQSEHADEAIAFHLHEGDGKWYMEGDDRVTVGEGLDLLPNFAYDRAEGFHALTIDGTAYDQRDAGTDFAFSVDDALVDPTAWEPEDGETIRVDVTTGG
ncbi:hypothetical protein [Natronomonas amylolytica]|uniref:hypothetical protein n=1 Tax=Natronomonas amylolytica TaxID=3108498 RepID=UPI00300873BD